MKQLYFVRHGQTEWNAIRRMQGQWNSNLNELGRSQADVNGRLLAKLNVDALFASPLDRTRQTADIINQYLDLPVTYDSRIMEWDCGDWSGYLYDEVQEKWPQQWQSWRQDPYHYRGPNCENYPDMVARATPFLQEIMQLQQQQIAIVSHGMIGRVMVSRLLGLNETETLGFQQTNDTVFRVTLNGELAEVGHYVDGDGPYPGLP